MTPNRTNRYVGGMADIPISEARDNLADIVSRAEHTQERTVLTRRGKPVAALIPIQELREIEAAEDAADIAAARDALADPAPRIPHAEVMRELGLG